MIDINETRINLDEELQIYHCGMEKCDSGHYYGPAVRDHYLIHFILDGEGIFEVDDNVYRLRKNQAFLIEPDVITYYQADHIHPWTYCWIGFNGLKAYPILKDAGFTMKSPILELDDSCTIVQCMDEILDTDSSTHGGGLKKKAYLYLILSEVQRINHSRHPENFRNRQKQFYVDKALRFIEGNYSLDITVNDIADYIGLNRSYFSEIFKEEMNISPKGYIVGFRMKKAARLLDASPLSVGDIARSVGYNDPLCFSKIFKKVMGISPLGYKKVKK